MPVWIPVMNGPRQCFEYWAQGDLITLSRHIPNTRFDAYITILLASHILLPLQGLPIQGQYSTKGMWGI
eukprot:1160538-Pelagomonas_calceolata.AAC.2